MRLRVPLLVLAAALAVAAAIAGFGCSSKSGGGTSGVTNPTPPSPELQSPTIATSGGSFSHTFAKVGAYGYHCGIHPNIMKGALVTVSDAASSDSVVVNIVGVQTPGFSPASVTVKTGGQVRWVNLDNTYAHSVVSD